MDPLKLQKVNILDIQRETKDVRTYTIKTFATFFAIPGQFNMIGYPGVGEAPISLSSVVRKSSFEHTIKSAGRLTKFLERLKIGDTLFLRGPYGRGWPLDEAKGRDILLVAGGVGLAPLRPVVQIIFDKRKLFGEVTLVYGARNEENVLFIDEFKEWEKKVTVYLTVDEVLSPAMWNYNVGLVTDILEKVNLRTDNTFVFTCGPEIMMRFICRGLIIRGIPQTRLYVSMERRMKCGIAHCGHCQHFGLFVCKDGPVFNYKQIRGLPDGLL